MFDTLLDALPRHSLNPEPWPRIADKSSFELHESNVRSYCRNFPAVFALAQGSRLRDVNGKSYIDFLSGAGALNYGHNNESIRRPLLRYIEENGITHGLDLHTVAKAEFIDSFQEHILRPRNLRYKMQFTGPTGTNAVEAALKLARKATGRSNVIAFSNAFHGMSLGALAATSNPVKRRGAGTALGGVTFMPFENFLGEGVDTIDYASRMIAAGGGVETPAAFLVETIQAEGGLRAASAEWLSRLAALAKSVGALLIVDDIQAGCGRSGTFFSFENTGVTPDIVCLSKSLSGYGLPLSLVLIRPQYDVWNPGEHNGTFRGNNLAFVTAKAAIETFWITATFQHSIAEIAHVLRERLGGLANRLNAVFDSSRVVGRGLLIGIEIPVAGMAEAVASEAFKDGLVIETCGVSSQVVKLLPALNIGRDDLAEGLEILEGAVERAIDSNLGGR